MRVRRRDIAQAPGYSVSTVSLALCGNPRMGMLRDCATTHVSTEAGGLSTCSSSMARAFVAPQAI